MLVPLMMQLRDDRDSVTVVRPNGTTRVVLGTRHPSEEDRRRIYATAHWGENHPAPRQTQLEAIEEPLPQRTQTILSTRVPAALQSELNGGIPDALPSSRRESMAGVNIKIKLHI